MIKVKILSVGKTKERWLEEAIQEYCKRLKSSIAFEFVWAKDDNALLLLAEKEPLIIALDPNGTLYTSEDFSHFLFQKLELGGSRLSFVIGSSLGLPQAFKEKHTLISLSTLTFTHQLTRLVLIEQIYRATEIAKGSAYHK
ncbi:MAG: 23S rRNA (pseudouridine(1915)-N(3))-methyltransferase RlmH [Chlamydiales bacterium]|nr:23S rRNA (pseudouridine(1915)-N(3))-methyltransferase RlmH [Chlamydiales bacterium]